MPTTYSIRSGAGGGAKLNSIGLNSVAWLDFDELRRGDLAIGNDEPPGRDLRLEIGARPREPDRRAGLVEHLPDLGHAVGDRDHGAQRRMPAGLAQRFHEGREHPHEHRPDVGVRLVE